jgi:signal transduction histidine kinase
MKLVDQLVDQTSPRASCDRIAGDNVATQVLLAQEAERRRFSREMHDDLAQKVALLEFQIEGMKRKFKCDPAIEELECLRGSVASLADDLHRICHRLHPVVLDNLGLVAGVEFLCNEHFRISGVDPTFVSEMVPNGIPSSVALCLYRIVQEALNNIHKHACAKQVVVALRGSTNGIEASVSDSGRGFEVSNTRPKSGLGLTFICERANLLGGQSRIHSTPGRGTRIEAFVPLAASDLAESDSSIRAA